MICEAVKGIINLTVDKMLSTVLKVTSNNSVGGMDWKGYIDLVDFYADPFIKYIKLYFHAFK